MAKADILGYFTPGLSLGYDFQRGTLDTVKLSRKLIP